MDLKFLKPETEDEIEINHIFDDYNSFVNYINTNIEEINGCTKDFINENYNGNIIEWYKDNISNNKSFNCKGCNDCSNCYKCINCQSCNDCEICENCKLCNNCSHFKDAGHCNNCKL